MSMMNEVKAMSMPMALVRLPIVLLGVKPKGFTSMSNSCDAPCLYSFTFFPK